MHSSAGKLFVMHCVITFLFLFHLSSMYADNPPISISNGAMNADGHPIPFSYAPTLQKCFYKTSVCLLSVEYPLEISSVPYSCGYPGFKVDCDPNKYEERPFINISNHAYQLLNISYESRYISLVDIDVEGSGCPQPKRNFSFPSSASWVNYRLSPKNVTVFYNCSSVPLDAEKHLLCSQDDTNTPPSYAFYHGEISKMFDWYRNCAQNVIVPVKYTNQNGFNYSEAIRYGFEIGWSAIDWCEDCERSGGQCWSIHNSASTGCACENNNSYNKTCPALTPTPPPPHHQGIHLGLKIMIGVFAGIGGLLFLAVLFVYTKKKFQRNKNKSPIM